MPKTGVIFDFGRVLGQGPPSRMTALNDLYGLGRADVQEFFSGPNALETQLGGAKFSTADMIPLMTERLTNRLGVRAAGAAHLMCSAYLGTGVYDQELLTLVKDLHAAGIRLGLLANGPSDSEFGIMVPVLATGLFCSTVISGRDGVGKPSAEAFDLILERMQLTKPEVCFIDDQQFQVNAAEALGITSFAFQGDVSQLREQLRAEGLPA